MKRSHLPLALLALAALADAPLAAQLAFLPPPGDNQVAEVTQHMGPVAVTVRYSSPDVHSPTGEDRAGHIWGELVPWGIAPNPFYPGYGTAEQIPWRGGANMNTTVRFSHDVTVEGQPLAAGTYGLHFLAGPEQWVVIFSHDSNNWGSFFYEPAHDALRVTVKPEAAEYREWLAYDFLDRQLESTVLALHWERLRVPIRVAVPDMTGLLVSLIDEALGGGKPGSGIWQNWNSAAQVLLARQARPEKALEYAQQANGPFNGGPNFQTLSTLSQAQAANGQEAEAEATFALAIAHPAATANQLHQAGRQLVAQGKKETAMKVFQANFDRFQGDWPTEVGMTRGLSALGRYAEALEHAKKALAQARERNDTVNTTSLEAMIPKLEAGQDVN
jgi:tetratricopeptide (TPR) repeat protein